MFAAVALLVLLSVFVSFVKREGDEVRSPGEMPSAPKDAQILSRTQDRSPGPVRQEPEQESEEEEDAFEATTCWRDLERFNAGVTLENFREWSASLRASGDGLVADYLKERLQELIGQDVRRAQEVLGWARESSLEEAALYLAALRDSEAVHQPQVARKLTEMGLDERLEPERRTELLSALSTQKRFAPDVIEKLSTFARDPSAGEAGWAVTHTLGSVMERDFNNRGNPAPYLDALLTIGTESLDEQIREAALTIPMHTAPVLDERSTERFARVLMSEGSEDGRDAAAHNLSLSQDKNKVLDIYSRAFLSDPSECARWAIFRFTARAAGRDGLPVMAQMAQADPRFQRDYLEFERIYASGVIDFERVWLSLSDQDPHNCFHRHEE